MRGLSWSDVRSVLDEFSIKYEAGAYGFTVPAPVMHGFRNSHDAWRVRSGSGIAGRGRTWMIVRVHDGEALSAVVSTKHELRRALREHLAGPVPDPEHRERYYAAKHRTRFQEGHYVWKIKSWKLLDHIHVVKLKDRDEARQLIGFKHINGTHKWDSYAKARFAAEWYRAEKRNGVTLEDIARSLGDRHDTVQRLVQGILVLDQARAKGLFEPDGRYPGRIFFFSHLYTALTRPEYRGFLKLPERWRDTTPAENPVPDEALPNLKELLNWLYGSKEDNEPPVITSQNPDVKQLGEVLGNQTALNLLRVDRNLRAAYERSGARSRQFAEAVVKALAQAEKAAAVVSAYEGEPALLESAEDLVKVARQLHASMKATADDEEDLE